MPIYAYKCESCGHAKDVLQKLSDAPLTDCPACGASSFRKQVTAAGFQLKGSGWYATDFRNGGAKPPASGEGEGKGGDAKPAETPAGDGAGSGAKATESPPAAGKPAEGKSTDSKSADGKSAGKTPGAPASTAGSGQ